MASDSFRIIDCNNPVELLEGIRLAQNALANGELIVIPTDTVYGVAADAFNPAGVAKLFEAKQRSRNQPAPVLVPDLNTLKALSHKVPNSVEKLVEKFWPGALTIVLPAGESLQWDLGESHGTVALRQPDNQLALAILKETGPLAVSSANLSGQAAAKTIAEAVAQLGENIAVYFDAGISSEAGLASTIIDASDPENAEAELKILRSGPITAQQLAEVSGAKVSEAN